MVFISSLDSRFAARSLRRNQAQVAKSARRLATGTRINGAADDPGSLGKAQRLQATVRGRGQVIRNLNDTTSMLQVTESALSEVMVLLQRGRELASQAAQGSLSVLDVRAIETEFAAVIEEIERVGAQTTYNGKKLLDAGSTRATGLTDTELTVVDELRAGWLRQSEILIEQYYGLIGDGADMTMAVTAIDGPYGVGAYVSGSFYSLAVNPAGTGFNIEMVIDVDDYLLSGDEYDSTIAHEMVHAVMNRTVNMYAIADGTTFGSGTWFKEGTAEFIPGADDRVVGTLTRQSAANIRDRVVELVGGATWGGGGAHSFLTADDYSAGYIAVRYLHDRIKTAGGEGIKDVMDYLRTVQGSSVETALQNIAAGGYAGGLSDFATDFNTNGLAFINAMDLTNEDTGAIGGLDADSGEVRTTQTVIPDVYEYEVQPLEGWNVLWPLTNEISLESSTSTSVITGDDGSGAIEVESYVVDRYSLGLDDVELTSNASESIGRIDRAIDLISEAQSGVGAQLSRIESAVSVEQGAMVNLTAAEGRLIDTDFAAETADLVSAQVLSRAAAAMVAQGARSDMILTLLGA